MEEGTRRLANEYRSISVICLLGKSEVTRTAVIDQWLLRTRALLEYLRR